MDAAPRKKGRGAGWVGMMGSSMLRRGVKGIETVFEMARSAVLTTATLSAGIKPALGAGASTVEGMIPEVLGVSRS